MESFLRQSNLFSDAEIEQINQLTTVQNIKKGAFFIQEGSVCNKVAFVKTGVFRHFIVSDTGDEMTYCLTFPNQFITAYSSFITHQPTAENIEALTDAEILVVSKNTLETVFKGSPNWLVFAKNMAEIEYVKLENRVFSLLKNKAKQRYAGLLRDNPEYIQQIPLQYLASYLGITQRHLSRLRRDLIY